MGHAQGLLGIFRRRKAIFLPALTGIALASASAWLLFSRSGGHGFETRMPASAHVQIAGPADLPRQIENLGAGGRVWALRESASREAMPKAIAEAAQFVLDSQALLEGKGGARNRAPRLIAPILLPEGADSPGLLGLLPFDFAEALDASGKPVRWQAPEHVIASYNIPRPAPFAAPPPQAPASGQFARALAKLAPAARAGDYRQLVDSFARRYGLNTDLVMAIIHSESNFTPTLVSPKSAMGLMQLLPSTASDEVHRFLYGRRGQVSFQELAVPEINIRYGTAYLHILNNKYFQNVHDKQVREACVIAAYNMGPNGFLRLYGATPEQAVAKINSMGSDEFHEDLPRRLPMRETRFYVEKVKRMKQHYAGAR